MKKYIINFITIVLMFIFASKNFAFAEKIVCKVEENYGVVNVFLFLCDDNDKNSECIWVKELVAKKLDKDQMEFLNQIDGIQIIQQDKRYKKLKKLIKRLENLDYNPLQQFSFNLQIPKLNTKIFEILGNFLE